MRNINLILFGLHITLAAKLQFDLSGTNKILPELSRFWTSTGLSPPIDQVSSFLLSQDMELNLAIIGGVPNNGISYVRVHWLLDLVTDCENEHGCGKYNFTNLDQFLQIMKNNGLTPGFELMGSPPSLNKNFPSKIDREWKEFLDILLKRYLEKFGRSYVRNWRFETLNEPDLRQYNSWNLTLSDYINYVQATSDVLSRYNLSLWGPAGLFKNAKHHERCWGLLDHCRSETCGISVLSFHKKGNSKLSTIISSGEELVNYIGSKYPNFKSLPISNDEADPLSGWWKSTPWRADVRYAAGVVQTVIGHLDWQFRSGVHIAAISNDNGFLSYNPHSWTQRTLLARIQMNNTRPTHVQLFKKPVYNAMTLLSLLDKEILSFGYQPGNKGLSHLATKGENKVSLIFTHVNDNLNDSTSFNKEKTRLTITLPYSDKKRQGFIYLLDNKKNNPAKLWKKSGSPVYPDKKLRRKLRRNADDIELVAVQLEPKNTIFEVELTLNLPSLVFINICECGHLLPGHVTDLRYLNITNNEILLLWSDRQVESKCLKSYVVSFRKNNSKAFSNISTISFFSNSFFFDGCMPSKNYRTDSCSSEESVQGTYQVFAQDYCLGKGPSAFIDVY